MLLVPRHPPGQLVELAVVERRAGSTRSPKWPNSAVAARNASDWVRPVVWACGGPTWQPITDGGISVEAWRWIVWRSSASLQSLVHTRSVRVRMPRSIRAPPDEQLSISTPGWRARSSSSSRYRASVWAWVPARPVDVGGLHVVAVHVPLDEGDVVVAEQRVEAAEHLGEGVGVGEVEHELVAAEHRLVAGVDQRPVRMGAVEVAVGVDHLRLDPDPELHAERRAPARSAGPDRRDGRRVTPTSRRDPARSSRRPPNHPSSRTKRSTPTAAARSARRDQRVEVVVEVDRLPGVEHAPGGGRGRLVPADDGVELPAGRRCSPAGECTAYTGGVRYDSPGASTTSPGMQQLAELEHGPAVGQPLGADPAVAAPRQVGAPHLAALLAEAGRAGPQHRRGLVRRAPAPVLGDERARSRTAGACGWNSRHQRPWYVTSSVAWSGTARVTSRASSW